MAIFPRECEATNSHRHPRRPCEGQKEEGYWAGATATGSGATTGSRLMS